MLAIYTAQVILISFWGLIDPFVKVPGTAITTKRMHALFAQKPLRWRFCLIRNRKNSVRWFRSDHSSTQLPFSFSIPEITIFKHSKFSVGQFFFRILRLSRDSKLQ